MVSRRPRHAARARERPDARNAVGEPPQQSIHHLNAHGSRRDVRRRALSSEFQQPLSEACADARVQRVRHFSLRASTTGAHVLPTQERPRGSRRAREPHRLREVRQKRCGLLCTQPSACFARLKRQPGGGGGGGCLKGAKHQAVRSTAPTCRWLKRPRATVSTCAPSRQGRKLASRMSAARVESCAGRAARRSRCSWARSLRAASGANRSGSLRAAANRRLSTKYVLLEVIKE